MDWVCATELPVGFELAAANAHDGPRLKPLLAARHPRISANTEAVMADRACDSAENCEYLVTECRAQAIIGMRRWLAGDEVCPAGAYRCTELGAPVCLGEQRMVYWGRDGGYLKWRCPVAVGAEACGRAAARTRRTARCSSSRSRRITGAGRGARGSAPSSSGSMRSAARWSG